MRQSLKKAIGVVTFGLPVSITCLDLIGSIAQVTGPSMQPVLNPNYTRNRKNSISNCDFIYINKWSHQNKQFERGQIVTLRSPTDPAGNSIKRIIAVEGDLIRTNSFKNRYTRVPQGCCWVEGENKQISLDSNHYGSIPISLIYGRASHIIWPPWRWQKLETTPTPDRILSDKKYPTIQELDEMEDSVMDSLDLPYRTSVSTDLEVDKHPL